MINDLCMVTLCMLYIVILIKVVIIFVGTGDYYSSGNDLSSFNKIKNPAEFAEMGKRSLQ